ncbi:MAG: LacI family DNA-binding transcriptional regulator [Armatimonadota bacterium]
MTTHNGNGRESAVRERPVTLQMVADRAGCSVITVSRALRGERKYVSAATVDRIVSLAGEMGYNVYAQDAARQMRLSRDGKRPLRHIIGVLIPGNFVNSVYHLTTLQGTMDELTKAGYATLVVQFLPPQRLMDLPTFARGELDGIVTMGNSPDLLPLAEKFSLPSREFPLVAMVHQYEGMKTVRADDYQGGKDAAAHLLDLGHRSILTTVTRGPIQERRANGYKDACLDRGLVPEEILRPCSHWSSYLIDRDRTDGLLWRTLEESLTQWPDTSAILAPNDFYAIKIFNALHTHGIQVPRDISLIGFDDTHSISTAEHQNILTTVRVPLFEIGAQAARLAIRQIAGEPVIDDEIVLPTHLVVRASTCPPTDKTTS